MKVLLESNILLRLSEPDHPHHGHGSCAGSDAFFSPFEPARTQNEI
jgi:hypothetical protein